MQLSLNMEEIKSSNPAARNVINPLTSPARSFTQPLSYRYELKNVQVT